MQFKNFDEVPYAQSGKAFPYENLKYHFYNVSNDQIGIYVDTKAYPAWLKDQTPSKFFVLDGSVYNDAACQNKVPSPDEEYNATLPNYAMPTPSKGAYTFIYNTRCERTPYPANPSGRDPQLYMGLHAAEDTPTDKYTEESRQLDNYIYENHMLEVVGAGNYRNNRKGLMNAKAYAANAITVGFVDTKNEMGFFSAWANAPYTNAGKTVRGPMWQGVGERFSRSQAFVLSKVSGSPQSSHSFTGAVLNSHPCFSMISRALVSWNSPLTRMSLPMMWLNASLRAFTSFM